MAAARFIDEYLKGVVEVREYKTAEQHDLDLKAGRVDLVMASTGYLMTSIKKPGNSDIVITGPRFLGGFLGAGSSVGLRKSDPELKAYSTKRSKPRRRTARSSGFPRSGSDLI
jgi:octopine/nopaline transport system substrate-binding protein